ncbi:MAG TPA: RNA-guided pseudouridylation complex pseudouridine synthase subunit Cbf5 [Candidatus Pacearchaeota archaeon]|nr:tRNA pseudouridine synthase B [archaeon BMS3Abin17]HDK41836.1 RNA-guided pseudouridylation complex pseudouridine synthase subunit Cbf5 [Candidatus Pacearchaeota archaeon]HDZ60528.1 RNA-guided pseudouridylation complex pseudouridine synthase subunit Cbf5 [Candidatus Pacearchaeota archaeon]
MKKSIQELLEFGIININKPSGPTSFDVSDFVRRTLKLRKTSHFGTLDPKVTGVLPVALNRACKLTGYFLGEDKEYIGIMRIHEDISLDKIKKAIKDKFTGKILQTPPVKSRVKRQERQREIKKFELLEKSDKDILFHVECEGGTYIRKLVDDLGKELGIGAHMLELRRIRAGIFKENDKEYPSINLYDLEKASKDNKLLKKIIIPAEIITELHPRIDIKGDNVKQVLTGKPIHKSDLKNQEKKKTGEIVVIFSEDRFIGMYKVVNSGDIFAKSEFVMQDIK